MPPLHPSHPSTKVAPELDLYEKDTMRLMTGYMVYDLIVELVTPAQLDYAVLFHHVAGLLSHWHTLQVRSIVNTRMLVGCVHR